jgi:cytochrome oxidase Cu insertion factor (SCO1/SenC/PrrC family)
MNPCRLFAFCLTDAKTVGKFARLARSKPTPAISSGSGARLKDGDEMPVFNLTNQNGEQISPDSFRGQPFVLTFIFTRCPLPNFCPRTSNNFEELQTAIKGCSDALAEPRLLSITLDPDYDTPKVLSDYADYHHADAQIWTLQPETKRKSTRSPAPFRFIGRSKAARFRTGSRLR